MDFCYICDSTRFVDQHHYDCQGGRISPETVPLCRRCHSTYHSWGLGAFSPDTTARALEVENYRRKICKLPLIMEAEIQRSSYWRKKHGRPSLRKAKQATASPQLPLFDIDSRIVNLASSGTVLATFQRRLYHAQQGIEQSPRLTYRADIN